MPKTIGRNQWPERLKTLRTRLDLTQAKAAERIHVSQSVWSAWERGAKTPSAAMLLLVELAFPEISRILQNRH